MAVVLAMVFLTPPASPAVASPAPVGIGLLGVSVPDPQRSSIASPMQLAVAANATLSAQEWLDTIRVPLRSDEAREMDEGKCPGVGAIAFDPGSAQPSAVGKRSLDALATALASPDFADSRFQVLWLANAAEESRLADQRASVIAVYLRSLPSLPAARLTIQPASAAFEDCSEPAPANSLLLQVRIAGRWWGGP
jgi:hypothetical protein